MGASLPQRRGARVRRLADAQTFPRWRVCARHGERDEEPVVAITREKLTYDAMLGLWKGQLPFRGFDVEVPGTPHFPDGRAIDLLNSALPHIGDLVSQANRHFREFLSPDVYEPVVLLSLGVSTSAQTVLAWFHFHRDDWGFWWVEFLPSKICGYSPVSFGRELSVYSYEPGAPRLVRHVFPDPTP
jgi:hypothetical protein